MGTIRQERTFESFSRGLEVVRAIQKMWEGHSRLPPGSNAQIETNIRALMAEFDLTIDEWHYWADQTIAALKRTS